MDTRKVDVNNAFNGDLLEDVYMCQPLGFEASDAILVYKLKKVIYRLKKALRAWYQNLYSCLLTMGFHISKSDSSLFLKGDVESLVIILVYIDDIMLIGSVLSYVNELISNLNL